MRLTWMQQILLCMPLVFAGVCNMIFVKSSILASWRIPMDVGLCLHDGKRLFGANKTWKGFVGMIGWTTLWMILISRITHNVVFPQTLPSQIIFGATWGLAYVLGELPNSVIKRRLDIAPGRNVEGSKGLFFLWLDQADSAIACALILPLFVSSTWLDCVALVLVGSGIHFAANVALFYVGLKSQRG